METSGEAGSEDITCGSMAQKACGVGKTYRVGQNLENEGHPHPRCFAKRVCKRLKINGAPAQKRGKRKKETASHCKDGSCEIWANELTSGIAKAGGKGVRGDTRGATQIIVKTREL